MCKYVYVFIYIYVNSCMYMCISIYTYIHTCVLKKIHIYINMHIHILQHAQAGLRRTISHTQYTRTRNAVRSAMPHFQRRSALQRIFRCHGMYTRNIPFIHVYIVYCTRKTIL